MLKVKFGQDFPYGIGINSVKSRKGIGIRMSTCYTWT